MIKYSVYAIIDAGKFAGYYEANSKEEAEEKAEEAFSTPSLCHQCANDVDLGDVIRFEANLEEDN